MRLPNWLTFAPTVLLVLVLAACGGADRKDDPDEHEHGEEEAHEHGADSHSHEMSADTAGTYVDSTGAFFDDADTTAGEHVHGPATHSH